MTVADSSTERLSRRPHFSTRPPPPCNSAHTKYLLIGQGNATREIPMLHAKYVLICLCTTISCAFGQAGPAPTTSTPNATTQGAVLTKSKYSGRVQERGGTRWSDFEFDFTTSPATMIMYRAERACKTAQLRVVSDSEGVVRIGSMSDIAGCPERLFELKGSGDELRGTLTVETRVFDVQANKK